ncbi:hypothetical protein CNR22_06925 [Sphingobacteriaceae bacterium]|nr:hypothetical protein CNR22_06925 [Sphingobacteriaceae bacterium]
MKKNILLICWDFPPNDGIGGRRWAKLAKGLQQHGYFLHVIKAEIPRGNNVSPWFKDVKNEHILLYELKPYWLKLWLNDYTSLFSKIKIKIAQLALSIGFKGTIYDKAIGIQKRFLHLSKSIIEKNKIDELIVTGAPFNIIYYAALLKKEFPDLRIIADYRDPWINSVNYGIAELSEKRLQEEKNKQDLVFKYADVITAPNEFLIEQIKETHTGKSNSVQFKALPHFFDPDDFILSKPQAKDPAMLKLVYAGALYNDSDRYLELLADALLVLKKNYPEVAVQIDFYTNHTTKVFLNKGLNNSVRFLNPIGDKIFEVISNYDFSLILLADHNKDFKTTKFFEFLPYRVPYLYVGPEGFVSNSIANEKLGYVLKSKQDLTDIYNNRLHKTELSGFNSIAQHSLSAVVQKLIPLLKNN